MKHRLKAWLAARKVKRELTIASFWTGGDDAYQLTLVEQYECQIQELKIQIDAESESDSDLKSALTQRLEKLNQEYSHKYSSAINHIY